MWIRNSSASYKLRSLLLLVHNRHVSSPGVSNIPDASTSKYKYGFDPHQGLHLLNQEDQQQNEHITKMGKVVNNHLQQAIGPKPYANSKRGYPSWVKYILGAILSIFLPFWMAKWNQLVRLEGEVEMAVEIVENVAEVVEKVATVTEKLSAEVVEHTPNDGKIKEAALVVERLAEEAVKDAQLTEDIIHKVGELKQEVETLIEPLINREREASHAEKILPTTIHKGVYVS